MITGAASGIGRSLARRLSGLGSPVAIADIDEAGLKETARTLPGPVLVPQPPTLKPRAATPRRAQSRRMSALA